MRLLKLDNMFKTLCILCVVEIICALIVKIWFIPKPPVIYLIAALMIGTQFVTALTVYYSSKKVE